MNFEIAQLLPDGLSIWIALTLIAVSFITSMITAMFSLGGLSIGSASARDEALLVVDGSRAARAVGFRYPHLSAEHAMHGHATLGAPATPRAPAAGDSFE